MAYEVTKVIAGRAYRYRVERVLDPETGKRRSRWTYLGRAGQALREPPAQRARGAARGRLLDALERLLETRDFAAVTADAIAAEAGLAHGTFYRHFHDKRDALRGALQRVREQRGVAVDALDDGVATEEAARAALRALVERVLSSPAEHPALLRALYGLAARDEELARERRERKATGVRALAAHLDALTRRGLASVRDPEAAAGALLAMIDGLYRDAVLDGIPLDAARIAGAAAVFEAAVFARDPGAEAER